ncbi:hypothetical protein BDV93DRAFT_527186 [Ceratobasidium sp. AG-I]|nr:hypothetical protein BDV93DRAFT_527186 [Ceratobasidium sp. AG-I]
MPPKRSNPSASADDGPPAKKVTTKKAVTKKAATTKAPVKKGATKKAEAKKAEPKLKKSTAPNWEEHSEWSQEKPTGKWAKRCDTSIEEKHWQTYHRERSALDKINTLGGGESRSIESEDLGCDTWWVLRHAAEQLAATILGSSLDDEEHKKRIAHTLLGSLYFTGLDGQNDCDGSPRTVDAKTRLYSPFGIGTSIDLCYSYHYRMRGYGSERFASLWVKSKTIEECDAKKPNACTACECIPGRVEKAAAGAATLFNRGGNSSRGTTAANIERFEKPLFGCEGWLSPLKLTNLLHAAATVFSYEESDDETLKSASEKFKFFQGEDDGKGALAPELARLAKLEEDEPDMPDFDEIPEEGFEICIPQRLLLLARQVEVDD